MNEELEKILGEVRNLYLKYGIKSVTMDDVAREIGISKKTLYTHIKDKNDLVGKVIDMEMLEHKCQIDKLEHEKINAIEELLEVNRQVNEGLKHMNPVFNYDLKKYYPELYKKLATYNRDKLYEAIVRNIQKGKQEGYFREDLNEKILAKLYVMRFEFFSENEMMDKEEVTSQEFINEVFDYHIRGLANERGIRLYEEKIKDARTL